MNRYTRIRIACGSAGTLRNLNDHGVDLDRVNLANPGNEGAQDVPAVWMF